MYRKSIQGWLKHWDFILLDILVLQVSYILGDKIRHGWDMWPYLRPDYRTIAIVLVALDLLVSVAFNTMHNVLKRERLKEFIESFRHVALVLILISLYLFSTQTVDISRIVIYLMSGFHLVLGFLTRLLWKRVIRSLNRNRDKGAMILVADESAVDTVLEHAGQLEDARYTGIILTNRNGTGEIIRGIPVVAGLENAADYICREWVDEVFVYSEHVADEDGNAELIEQCREMAIPVHLRLPFTAGGKSFMEKVGGYNVLTLTANYASPFQLIVSGLWTSWAGSLAALSP